MYYSTRLAIGLSTVLALNLIGCSDQTASTSSVTKTPINANSAPTKEPVRVALLKDLETRAAQSDTAAQLELAKAILDGTETPPNYERAKGLFFSASEKGIPEATLGLYFLKMWGVIADDKLPTEKQLKEQAIASDDPFVNLLLFHPSVLVAKEPPAIVVKLAEAGYPLANARMASYLSEHVSFAADYVGRGQRLGSHSATRCRQ